MPGLVDVRSSLEAGNPELQVVFDRERLASLGLDMGVLSETLRSRVLGVVPTRFKEEDRQIDIRLRNRESDRHTAEDVRNLALPGPGRHLPAPDLRGRRARGPRPGRDPPPAAAARRRRLGERRGAQPRRGRRRRARRAGRPTRRRAGSAPSWAARTRR
ncbi:MAG: efflux RND transporter permease subunit [bacterium]|nr:efflux RND transporter permease subunit [bacterium]